MAVNPVMVIGGIALVGWLASTMGAKAEAEAAPVDIGDLEWTPWTDFRGLGDVPVEMPEPEPDESGLVPVPMPVSPPPPPPGEPVARLFSSGIQVSIS